MVIIRKSIETNPFELSKYQNMHQNIIILSSALKMNARKTRATNTYIISLLT